MSKYHKIQFLKRFKDVYYIDYRMFILLTYLYIIFILTIIFIYNGYRETRNLLLLNKVETSELLMKIHDRFEIFEDVETDKMGVIISYTIYDKL